MIRAEGRADGLRHKPTWHFPCTASLDILHTKQEEKDTGKTGNEVQPNSGPQPKDYSCFQGSVNYDNEEGNSQQFQKKQNHTIWINIVPFLEARRMYQAAFQKLRTKPSPSDPSVTHAQVMEE